MKMIITGGAGFIGSNRSEEHTSELQSLRHLVCRLLLPRLPITTLFPYTTLFRSRPAWEAASRKSWLPLPLVRVASVVGTKISSRLPEEQGCEARKEDVHKL